MITLMTTGNLHFFAYRKGEVYVAALSDNFVYTLDANDDLVFKDSFAAQSPIGIAFSADGNEMFATGHITSDVLQPYTFANDTWTAAGTMDLGSSLGGSVIVPG